MDSRQKIHQQKRLKNLEQVLRSKIWADLVGTQQGSDGWKKQAELFVRQWQQNWPEERIWQNEESLSRYKIELVAIYGGKWAWRGRKKNLSSAQIVENLTLTQAERKESARLTEELLYWHLTNFLTEAEKFQALNLILQQALE